PADRYSRRCGIAKRPPPRAEGASLPEPPRTMLYPARRGSLRRVWIHLRHGLGGGPATPAGGGRPAFRRHPRHDSRPAPPSPRRPAPSFWSPLDSTCHVRDVLRVQGERLALALRTDNPQFVPMGREERVILDAYNAQDPQTVLTEPCEPAPSLPLSRSVVATA